MCAGPRLWAAARRETSKTPFLPYPSLLPCATRKLRLCFATPARPTAPPSPRNWLRLCPKQKTTWTRSPPKPRTRRRRTRAAPSVSWRSFAIPDCSRGPDMPASASPPKQRAEGKKNQAVSTKARRVAQPQRAGSAEAFYDVIIAGGGPAGSTLAWKLASQGVKVLLLERTKFPREKVCGDCVEPRGLRILGQMSCLAALEATSPLPITHSSTWVDDRCEYSGKIPFYGVHDTLLPHGYIVPRQVLDTLMLEIAAKHGAEVHYESYVTGFTRSSSFVQDGVTVEVQSKGTPESWRGRAIVGADGVNSVVARTAGLLVNDPRHIALSQRAYVTGYSGFLGEAAFFFDAEFFPGYGWMFPMSGGMANIGVGALKETCQREG